MARLPAANPAQVSELLRRAGYPQDTPFTSVFHMLAHAPAVAAPALQLAAAILTDTELDAKVRQLVILRVVQRSHARYAWIQHAAIAAVVGVRDEQIAALEKGELPYDLFTYQERLALAFADEILCSPSPVPDVTFACLGEQFSAREVVELLLIVGYFRMVASLMTTLEVELDAAWAAHALDQVRAADVVA